MKRSPRIPGIRTIRIGSRVVALPDWQLRDLVKRITEKRGKK